MRVLVVTNMYPTPKLPGSGTFVATQVESLRGIGLDVEVLHVPRAEVGRSVYRGLGRKVRELAVGFRSSVVHVMYGGVMADTVTRALAGRPVVVSFCGSDLLGGGGQGVLERLALRHGVRASYRAAGRAAGVIVKSQNLLKALPSSVPRARAWLVPNGIDLARFRPLDPEECRRKIGWDAGRQHVLFPARRSRPEKQFPLAAAGVRLLDKRGVSVELHELDGVRHDDVPVWLNAAHVVLLTSAYEGSPNALKEALACDVPVVSVDVGDVKERLDGIAGCFLADPTAEDIAAKIERALAHPERINGRGAVADLALERVAARLRDIYDVVIRSAPSSIEAVR